MQRCKEQSLPGTLQDSREPCLDLSDTPSGEHAPLAPRALKLCPGYDPFGALNSSDVRKVITAEGRHPACLMLVSKWLCEAGWEAQQQWLVSSTKQAASEVAAALTGLELKERMLHSFRQAA